MIILIKKNKYEMYNIIKMIRAYYTEL